MTPATAAQAIAAESRWNTMREITQQPDVWRRWGPKIAAISYGIKLWLSVRRHDEFWFCGAGTSAFIGETLAAYLNRAPGLARFRAIPTTDFVASPTAFMRPGVRPLVVSFGRSGNSSESVATLDLLDAHAHQIDRLHITCNPDSALARRPHPGPGELKTIVLPSETNDAGFAMTSSYTTMLLSALACFDPAPPAPISELFVRLAHAADKVIDGGFSVLGQIAAPERAVFLGSGPLTGAARESALKVLELAAGQITTSWDSTLGFRHGPKAITNERTLVFVLESSDAYTGAYDRDLAAEVANQFGPSRVVRLGSTAQGAQIDIPSVGNDAWSAPLYVMVSQKLAVVWSEQLGLDVDDPFAGRNLTRVVGNVRLYPLPQRGPRLFGGIDLGGTKIESALFDAHFSEIARRRTFTRKASYNELLDCVVAEMHWLEEQAGGDVAIGVGIPGLVDASTGISVTANLPATGQTLGADLADRLARTVAIDNDCRLFALSEANGGAGEGHRTVYGLIIGTGVGAGLCVDAKLFDGLNRLPGEVGHLGVPAELLARRRLPLLECGCGRVGCYETLVSGPGLSRICEHATGRKATPEQIVAEAVGGDAGMTDVLDSWVDLVAELLRTIHQTIDIDCVVMGGGLSRIEGIAERLQSALSSRMLSGVKPPDIKVALLGDASGVRGAALLASRALGHEAVS